MLGETSHDDSNPIGNQIRLERFRVMTTLLPQIHDVFSWPDFQVLRNLHRWKMHRGSDFGLSWSLEGH